MKKLIILLLFPLVSFSQISYKDIMSIDSEKMFKKVMIENGYEYNSNDERLRLILLIKSQKKTLSKTLH